METLNDGSNVNTKPQAGLNFEALVEAHYQGLFQFGCRLTRDEEWARDLTQQTFYLALKKEGQLRDKNKAKSWLFTILYREFLKKKRHETRFPKMSIDDSDHELAAAPASGSARNDVDTVIAALDALEEKYRVPLALFYQDDHPYHEIAEILDIPIGTVMSRLSRGKAKLREALERAPRARRTMAGLASQLKGRLASIAAPVRSKGGAGGLLPQPA